MKLNVSGLRILQLNCRGLKSKLDDLDELLKVIKYPDVIIINETWLKAGESKFVDIKGYKFKGIHREHKKGGGVGFLIKEGIIYKSRPDLTKQSQEKCFEHYFIEIKSNSYNIIEGSIYQPPNTDVDRFLVEYNNSIETISRERSKEMILGMDHNLDLLKQTEHKKKPQDFIEMTLDN